MREPSSSHSPFDTYCLISSSRSGLRRFVVAVILYFSYLKSESLPDTVSSHPSPPLLGMRLSAKLRGKLLSQYSVFDSKFPGLDAIAFAPKKTPSSIFVIKRDLSRPSGILDATSFTASAIVDL